MRVLYIDVYFLINFTVNLLALYFSCTLLHFPIRRWRLCLCAMLGALLAVVSVLWHEKFFLLLAASFAILLGMIVLAGVGGGVFRRLRLALLFFLFEFLIGGIVHFGYGFLEEKIGDLWVESGVENRKLLYLCALILLALGILRLAVSLLESGAHEKSCEVEIRIGEKRFFGSALVDSGNFLRDPLDGASVVLIKSRVAERLLPSAFLSEDISALEKDHQKKLRLIPVRIMGSQRILLGIRPDDFSIFLKKKKEHVRVTVAYDKEKGDYEGYSVLISSSIAENVGV
jgi:stage II sporulation protein GA (sporulation sigma-E factor processing peptidase)